MTIQGISLLVVKSRVLRDVPQDVLHYAPFSYSHYTSLRTPTYNQWVSQQMVLELHVQILYASLRNQVQPRLLPSILTN